MNPKKARILTTILRRPSMYMREVTLSNAFMLTLGFELATAENNVYFSDTIRPWLAKYCALDSALSWEEMVEKNTADILDEAKKVAKLAEILDAYFQATYSDY